MTTTSWVIIDKNGKVITELRSKHLVAKLNTKKYDAIPIKKYLHYVNVGLALNKLIVMALLNIKTTPKGAKQ